jgi:hypothetical protein
MTYLTRRLRLVKADKPKDAPAESPGLKVTTDDNPVGGVHAHKIAGQLIGHTVNAVGKGWTAVPFSGQIKGGFNKHADAQQYLADQHAENIKNDALMEQAAKQAGGKVKKDDIEKGGPGSGPRKGGGSGDWHSKSRLDGESDGAYAARRIAQEHMKDNPGMTKEQAMAHESKNFQTAVGKLFKDGNTEENAPGNTKAASSSTTSTSVVSSTTSTEDQFQKWDDYDPEYVAKREFTAAKRKADAKSGAAMPGGGYPIENVSDLHNAIEAYGRAKNPAKTKAHIRSRAAALGATSALPDSWGKSEDLAEIVAKIEMETEREAVQKDWQKFDEERAKGGHSTQGVDHAVSGSTYGGTNRPGGSQYGAAKQEPGASGSYSKENMDKYVAGLHDVSEKHRAANGGGEAWKKTFETREGDKWNKVIAVSGNSRSVHSFVNRDTGDIHYPAGAKGPTKQVRGNIGSPANGMEAIGNSGHVRYLKSDGINEWLAAALIKDDEEVGDGEGDEAGSIKKDWAKFDAERTNGHAKTALGHSLDTHDGRAIGNSRKAMEATAKAGEKSYGMNHEAAAHAHLAAAKYASGRQGDAFKKLADAHTALANAHIPHAAGSNFNIDHAELDKED